MRSRHQRDGFVLIWGSRNTVRRLGVGGTCSRCGGRLIASEVQKWFTLFFIPLSPIGPARQVQSCGRCGQSLVAAAPLVSAKPMLLHPEPTDTTPKWWTWAFVAAALLILLLGFGGFGPAIVAVFFAFAAVAVCLIVNLATTLSDGSKILTCSLVTGGCWVAAFAGAIFVSVIRHANESQAMPFSPVHSQASTFPPQHTPFLQPRVNFLPTPTPPPSKAAASPVLKSELLGGQDGTAFQRQIHNDVPIVGFRWVFENPLAGRTDATSTVVKSLDPLSSPPLEDLTPKSFGRTVHGFCLGRNGYVVGGLNVDADRMVNAVQVIFMRFKDGHVDPSDQYTESWIGTPTGTPSRKLAGDGSRIVGVTGRRGAGLISIGLLTQTE